MAAARGVEAFDAFLAALLQNVGLTVALRTMDQVTKGEPQLGSGIFWAQLARDMPRLSVSIARELNFPETVVRAVHEQGGLRKGAHMSPLGSLLMLTDYLSKVRMLAEQNQLDHTDPEMFDSLSPTAADCYALLEASRA